MDSNLDILITRVVDGRATPADWASLDALGAADASVWRELGQAQKADQLLTKVVGEAVAAVERVELPGNTVQIQAQAGLQRRLRKVGAWGGWAAAAAVTLAFIGRPATPAEKQIQTGDMTAPISSAADVLKQYMD